MGLHPMVVIVIRPIHIMVGAMVGTMVGVIIGALRGVMVGATIHFSTHTLADGGATLIGALAIQPIIIDHIITAHTSHVEVDRLSDQRVGLLCRVAEV